MADISLTSAKIAPAKLGCQIHARTAGAALTVGYAGYIDSSENVQHADADAGETESRGVGIIVASIDGETSIASGAAASLLNHGPVEGYSGMTPGAPVYVSTNPGRLTHTKPTGGAYARSIGYALTATKLMVAPESSAPTSS
jgi:hypothetical protein